MSLHAVEAALYERLETLVTGNVAAIVRVAGDREAQANLEADSLTASSLIALALDRATPGDVVSVSSGVALQTTLQARWRVRIMTRDLAAHGNALARSTTGLYALVDVVLSLLTGFKASGLWANERVRFVAIEPVLHKPGRYIATLIFETRSALLAPDVSLTTSEPLVIHGDVNLISATGDDSPNPLTEIEV